MNHKYYKDMPQNIEDGKHNNQYKNTESACIKVWIVIEYSSWFVSSTVISLYSKLNHFQCAH